MHTAGIIVRASISQVQLLDWLCGAKYLRHGGSKVAVHPDTDLSAEDRAQWIDRLAEGYRVVDTAFECLQDTTIGLSIGWPDKLRREQFELPAHGTFNVHHGFRLKYRGRHMQTWAIRNRETHHGTTLHKMDESIDTGPIVDSSAFKIDPDETAYSLTRRCCAHAIAILDEWLPKLIKSGEFIPIDAHPKPKLHVAAQLDREIKINGGAEQFDREVRALTFPGMPKPFVKFRGLKWYISQTP